MSDVQLLDNIAWHTLVGSQAEFAAGRGDARRYASGFSPILGFADQASPDFAALSCPFAGFESCITPPI